MEKSKMTKIKISKPDRKKYLNKYLKNTLNF